MSVFSTTEIRKRSKAEEREQERAEKRNYKDIRWAVLRCPICEDDWETLLTLHGKYGKEGGRQLAHQLIPEWNLCQEVMEGGCKIPDRLWEKWKPQTPTTRSSRKIRSDAGKARK